MSFNAKVIFNPEETKNIEKFEKYLAKNAMKYTKKENVFEITCMDFRVFCRLISRQIIYYTKVDFEFDENTCFHTPLTYEQVQILAYLLCGSRMCIWECELCREKYSELNKNREKFFFSGSGIYVNGKEMTKEKFEEFLLQYHTISGEFWKSFSLITRKTKHDDLYEKIGKMFAHHGLTYYMTTLPHGFEDNYEAEQTITIYTNIDKEKAEKMIDDFLDGLKDKVVSRPSIFEQLGFMPAKSSEITAFIDAVNEVSKPLDDKGN